MLIATRIRMYPNADQCRSLAKNFGCARWVWNEALSETKRLHKETGKGLSFEAMAVRLPKLKIQYDWLGEANAQVLQQSVRNLSKAFANFCEKRSRYPRYKSKRGVQSIQFPQSVRVFEDRIKLPKLGTIRCVVHRKIVGTIKTVTVSRTACGHYYASVLVDDGVEMPPVSISGPVLGIDIGLMEFAVTSDAQHFPNPRHLRKAAKNLKRKQRKLSRKKKGSNSRDKARKLVARVHERVANARKDFLHKLSRKLVDENQVLAVEDLCVKGMVRNPSLARSISDAGWGTFSRFVEYKAARAGKLFVKINRFFPSSKTCHVCGMICDGMDLSVRQWTCNGCGTIHDRDENAACNIRDEASRMIRAGVIPTPAPGAGVAASGGTVSLRGGRKPSVKQVPEKLETFVIRRK